MELTAEQVAAHSELSVHNLAFVEEALGEPLYRRRDEYSELDRRVALRHYRLQRWPTLAGRAAVGELSRVAEAIHRIVLSIPERVFAGDPGRIADFYGFDPAFAGRTMVDPGGIARAPSRGDYMWTAAGLQCLEFNCGNSLGGWQMPMVAGLYLDHPRIAGFLRRRGLTVRHRNSMRLLFEHMIREALAAGIAGDGEVNLAFVIYPSDPDSEYARLIAPHQADLEASFRPTEIYDAELRAALGSFPGLERGQVLYCSYAALETRDGAAWLGDRRVHAVAEIVGFPTPEVFRCYREGGLQLYSGPISMMLGDKRNLALLSGAADAGDGPWDDEEREVVRRHVPWTRRVARGRERWRGEEVALPELLAAERERLVLKHGQSFGGLSVVVGRAASAAEWDDAVQNALDDGSWIVQEHVESRPFLYQQGDDGCGPHTVIWGLFVYGGRFAGALVRLQEAAGDAVVNIHRGASTSVLLEIEESDGAPT